MPNFYLYTLAITILVFLLFVVKKPERIFEYPYFMASVMAGFILPQAFSLIKFPAGVSMEAIRDTLFIASLCLVACAVGYRIKPSKSSLRFIAHPVDLTKFLLVGVFFAAVGLGSGLLIPESKIEFAERGGLTGVATIYIFFGSLAFPGFAICLYVARKRINFVTLAALLFSAIAPLTSIIHGRREPAAMIVISIAMIGYFHKRKSPRRITIFGTLLIAMLVIPATSDYRRILNTYGLSTVIRELNLVENFEKFVSQESLLELRNAAAVIQSTRQIQQYGLGAGYWNMMVHRFVPAQIVGRGFKDSLLIGTNVDKLYYHELAINYDIPSGYTITGMGDSYEQFGWFGCLFFALTGIMFKYLWTAAMKPEAAFAQVFYIMICSSAMRTITHQTVDFFPGVLYQLLFLGAGYIFSLKTVVYSPVRKHRALN